MIKGYQKELSNIYEKLRTTEQQNLKKRRAEILSRHPRISELDSQIQKSCLNLSLSILKGTLSESDIDKIRDNITDLRANKYEMLVSNGYSQEYLNMHYHCTKCKDNGFIGTGNLKCSCYKNKLIKLYYKDSDLEDAVKANNFTNFDINLYSNNKTTDDKYSPRRNMENILESVKGNYIPNFSSHDNNLLFYGNSGTGKTFLTCCIAKDLLDDGFLVVYKTSDELIRSLRDIRFNNNSILEELLINCDLLIIDDLGAEQITEFSATELFTLINKKILKNKKMLISTNLSLPMISKIYSERIFSRLVGNFKLCKFYADDIRIQINLKRK